MSEGVISIGSYLSFSATLPTSNTKVLNEALTWTDWDEPTNLGETGADAEVIKFTPLKTGVVNKRLGSTDSGTQSIEAPFNSTDAAQVILKAAKASKAAVQVRETLNTGDVYYYAAYVSQFKTKAGTASDIQTLMVTLEIDADILELTAAEAAA